MCLRAQEVTPGEPAALVDRPETRVPEELPHRRRRNRKAEAAQLTHDALITPTRVLTREP